MKALMQSRPDCLDYPGGDTVQMLQTRAALERLGVCVDIDSSETANVSEYDLVHVFNSLVMPAAYYQIMNAKRACKPVAYSPIFWNISSLPVPVSFSREINTFTNRVLKRISGRELVSREGHACEITTRIRQEAAFLASDILLPNAESEHDQIRSMFPRINNTAHIIPNGVDEDIASGNEERFRSSTGIQGQFVLCLASICPRKNQLRLAAACRSLGLLFVAIGGCNKLNQTYLSECRKAAGNSMIYIEALPHEAVKDALSACRIHALASSIETPGLATLEAAACGKNVVVCNRGSVQEYLGNDAFYCDYFSVNSIARAIKAAWDAPPPVSLTNRILTDFTWNRAAELTLSAYNEAINLAKGR